MSEFARLTVNLTEKSEMALKEIAAIDAVSETDAVNRALQVYAYLGSQLINGEHLALVASDGSMRWVSIT